MHQYLKGLIYTGLFLGFLSATAQNLQEAVMQSDTVKLLNLIHDGKDVNQADANGTSALMTACRWDNITMTRLLIVNGAKADFPRSPKGRTPLMIACAYYGGITITKALIANGADVNAVAADGSTALMHAAKNAKQDVVEYLLSRGANAALKDAAGLTALDYAQKAEITDFLKQNVHDTRLDKDAVIARLTAALH